MAKIIVVGVFLGIVLYFVISTIARDLIEYGKRLGREEVKKNKKQ